MSRRSNPYDDAMAESLMKTLTVEGVYPMAFETFDDVAAELPRFIGKYNDRAVTPVSHPAEAGVPRSDWRGCANGAMGDWRSASVTRSRSPIAVSWAA